MMRVMTFNLRFENDQDGDNAWFYRKEMVVRMIERHAPVILGTQEGRWSQLLYLDEQLADYRLHAPERVIDDTCQYPTLFYREDLFELEEGAEFWLSETPHVHRSKNWDSAFPRMMSYAGFRSKTGNILLWVAVTHLDHIGAEARYQQARMLAEWVTERNGPTILMGDFNDHPASGVHQALCNDTTGLRDTWQTLGKSEDEASKTHHGFKGIPDKTRMDWILVSDHLRPTEALIVRDQEAGRYPSDHYPYEVNLMWV